METTRPNVPTYPRGQLKPAGRLVHGDEIPEGLVVRVNNKAGRIPVDGNRIVAISVIASPHQADPNTLHMRRFDPVRVKTW